MRKEKGRKFILTIYQLGQKLSLWETFLFVKQILTLYVPNYFPIKTIFDKVDKYLECIFLFFSLLKPRPRLLNVTAFSLAYSTIPDRLKPESILPRMRKTRKTCSEGLKMVNSVLFGHEIMLWPSKIMQNAPLTPKTGLRDSIGRYETLGWVLY